MKLVPLKLVTVIAESYIADRIIREILALGATGYTATAAEGQGSRGVRASEWEGKNVKIETLGNDAVTEKILRHISEGYFADYAVVVYVNEVGVLRGDKYI